MIGKFMLFNTVYSFNSEAKGHRECNNLIFLIFDF